MTGLHDARATSRPLRKGRWLLWALVLLSAVGGVVWWRLGARDTGAHRAGVDGALPMDSSARAPQGRRITIRVVNGSQRRGLARRATLVLRDFGYDVVEYDGQGGPPLDDTEIVVHAGGRDVADRVQRALGAGRITARADSSRYVDLTVVLGRDWRPPAQPLRP